MHRPIDAMLISRLHNLRMKTFIRIILFLDFYSAQNPIHLTLLYLLFKNRFVYGVVIYC